MQDNATKTVPVLPFDITIGENFRVYDSFEYERDLALCDFESIRMYSGNVYKYYQQTDIAPRLIGDAANETNVTYL